MGHSKCRSPPMYLTLFNPKGKPNGHTHANAYAFFIHNADADADVGLGPSHYDSCKYHMII